MSMYFLDETDDWPEYQTVRDEIHRLEMKRAHVLKVLGEVKSSLDSVNPNHDLQTELEALEADLREIEKKLDETLNLYR